MPDAKTHRETIRRMVHTQRAIDRAMNVLRKTEPELRADYRRTHQMRSFVEYLEDETERVLAGG